MPPLALGFLIFQLIVLLGLVVFEVWLLIQMYKDHKRIFFCLMALVLSVGSVADALVSEEVVVKGKTVLTADVFYLAGDYYVKTRKGNELLTEFVCPGGTEQVTIFFRGEASFLQCVEEK